MVIIEKKISIYLWGFSNVIMSTMNSKNLGLGAIRVWSAEIYSYDQSVVNIKTISRHIIAQLIVQRRFTLIPRFVGTQLNPDMERPNIDITTVILCILPLLLLQQDAHSKMCRSSTHVSSYKLIRFSLWLSLLWFLRNNMLFLQRLNLTNII